MIIHLRYCTKSQDWVYLCNQAYILNPDKATNNIDKVTCKNCRRIIDRLNEVGKERIKNQGG